MASACALWTSALLFLPGVGLACGPNQTLYFSCQFSNGAKAVEICHDAVEARYRFGPVGGAPELALQRPLAEVGLTPWPGIGRTIWEEVQFRAGDHAYQLHAFIEREWPEGDADEVVVTHGGGITVLRDEKEIAVLTCDPDSVTYPWGTSLFDAKKAAGQCYDTTVRDWTECDN